MQALGAGAGADIRAELAGAGGKRRHRNLRCFVLDEEVSVAERLAKCAVGQVLQEGDAARRVRADLGGDARRMQRGKRVFARAAQGVHRKGDRRMRRERAQCAVGILAEIVVKEADDRRRKAGLHRPPLYGVGRQGNLRSAAEVAAQDAVEKGTFSGAFAEGDRLCDGGVRRDAVEVHQLIQPEPQDLPHPRADLLRVGGKRVDKVVEGHAPLGHAVDQRGEQGAVARVAGVGVEIAVQRQRDIFVTRFCIAQQRERGLAYIHASLCVSRGDCGCRTAG